jgi:Fe-S-cluster containining protein
MRRATLPSMPDDNGVPPGSIGTLPLDAPVTREELERALRRMNYALDTLREEMLMLAGQVVATADVAGIEPAVEAATPAAIQAIRENDELETTRLSIGDCEDKYKAAVNGPDCLSILPICKGRCCQFHFALSSQDLDEGVIRWDYGKPYLIRQRLEDHRCVHSDPGNGACTVYEHRPRPCRVYDCRSDQRIWADFDKRILADESPFARKEEPKKEIDLKERVRIRQVTMAMEGFSLTTKEAERMREEKKAK